jgi:hypothetical protein
MSEARQQASVPASLPQPIEPRFAQFPRALATHSVTMRLGGVPCLLVHPDWQSKRPMLLWMHGRTANKGLDAGRYLRCMRAGIACCAIDLPGHGERSDAHLQSPAGTLDVIAQAGSEIDGVLDRLCDASVLREAKELARAAGAFGETGMGDAAKRDATPDHASTELFDIDACVIGGMSLGGMTALARLCSPHAFRGCMLECTTGWFEGLYLPQRADSGARPWPVQHDAARVRSLDPLGRLPEFAPVPLLAMHSLSDAVVPWSVQRAFLDALRTHYARLGAPPSLIEVRTWPTTGAPDEHSGFGKVASEAKVVLVEFACRTLGLAIPS